MFYYFVYSKDHRLLSIFDNDVIPLSLNPGIQCYIIKKWVHMNIYDPVIHHTCIYNFQYDEWDKYYENIPDIENYYISNYKWSY